MWVFTYKCDSSGYLIKHKARIVVRGDLQPASQLETYAATLAARTFRFLMALVVLFDLETAQFDAVNAFVNSELDETVYCQSPPGFEAPGHCLRLRRALYGLRRSPLLWWKLLTKVLQQLGLKQLAGDESCLFGNQYLIVFFYVDDIVVLYHKQYTQQYANFKQQLLTQFEIKDLGELK